MSYRDYLKEREKLKKQQQSNISIAQASKLIGKSQQFVRISIQRNLIEGLGYCVKKNGKQRYDYFINKNVLYEYLKKEKEKELYKF